ncbi:MAG: class I SAM-dependent methyltransferase [Planctomycetota bacterium]|jgi:SAM-dependent methyltransferase
MDHGAILQRLRELAPWHFDVEVADGLRTVDGNREHYDNSDHRGVRTVDPEHLRPLLRRLYPNGLSGRSFLDVGCNAGAYCLLARQLGAGRALGFDVREHWIEQARFLKELLAPSDDAIEFRVCHIADLETSERVDLTLFKGVFYHLPDPIAELMRLCDITNEFIIIDTASMPSAPENCLVSTSESRTRLMSGVDQLAWLPGGPKAIENIVAWAGFEGFRVVYTRDARSGRNGRGRFCVIAARKESLLRDYDARR